jgi:hypothetical protein
MSMLRTLCLVAALLGAAAPAHAFWGVLGKLGSAAGKAGGAAAKTGTAAKAGAAGGAVAVGAEAELAAQAAAKAGATAGTAAAVTGDDIARASGLGKAVPDEIAHMLQAIPAKRLADVPDVKAREWLAKPVQDLKPAHASDIMQTHDRVRDTLAKQHPQLPASPQHSWYLAELTLRAAHLGHHGAKTSLAQRCQNDAAFAKQHPQHCSAAVAKPAQAGKEAKTKTPA